MKKMILKDKSEIEIREGASLSAITTDLKGYADLEWLSKKLTTENLKEVQFTTDDEPTGIYANMKMASSPRFRINETTNGIEVTFGLLERSEEELRYEALSQEVTDTEMAICELYEGKE